MEQKLIWFWDLVDISENMRRAEKSTEKVNNDFLSSGIHAIVYAVVAAIAFVLAWYFDFESTMIGMSTLTSTVLPGLPSSIQPASALLGAAFTIAPTLIEIFSGSIAKAQVKIVQIFVVAFTFFDMITDIPRAVGFVNALDLHFATLGLLHYPVKWIFFVFWLFLSTIGFELGLVIFAWLAIIYTLKAFSLRKVQQFKGLGGGVKSSGSKADVIELK